MYFLLSVLLGLEEGYLLLQKERENTISPFSHIKHVHIHVGAPKYKYIKVQCTLGACIM